MKRILKRVALIALAALTMILWSLFWIVKFIATFATGSLMTLAIMAQDGAGLKVKFEEAN